MLPQRERIVRKAKERIIDYSLSNFNKSNDASSLTNTTTPSTKTQKRNNRSYKPFITTASTATHGELDDQNGDDALNTSNNENSETPPKKSNKIHTPNASARRNKAQNSTKSSAINKNNRLRDINVIF